ncbi:MAG TPA: TRAM domain-containing protein [Acidimicrobiales bacterium]|nr:TRAM domain-containing protein [Acidimicrobiales bacterium]
MSARSRPRRPVAAKGARRPPAEPVDLQLSGTVAAGGDVIARLPDGRVVFVEGGLPGEAVRAVLTEGRRDFAKARVVEVVDASPDRVEPPCPWARAGCGGCQWQHIAPAAQLPAKAAIVADAFARIARVEPPPGPPPVALPPAAYRTTLRLAVGPDGRPAYRRRHSSEAMQVGSCLIAHPLLEELVVGTRLRPFTGEVGLRVGVAGGERLVLPTGGAVVIEAPVDAVVAAPGRAAALHEEAGRRRWRVSGESFFQSGPAAAELLIDAVVAAAGPLDPSATVVDLYAGVGLLGGVLAERSGARLVAVESSLEAAADARVNLADLAATVDEVEVAAWSPVAADVVVADPARSGLGRPGVAAVAATGAARVVLVSCDPASCARDTALLRDAGFEAVSLAVLDLFPNTVHVEAVVAFDRARRP